MNFKTKLIIGAENWWRMASNWVMTLAGVGFAVYLALPPDQQQRLVQALPLPGWMVPIAVSAIGIGARLWPQKAISPKVADAKSSDTPS